jgi:chemotaxis protein methyltransferase CheR
MLTGANCRPRLSQETFNLLRDIIYQKSGIYFADAKKYLMETRLARRLEDKNLKTYEDYYCFLTYDLDREKEVLGMLNSIVTNETSFFRDAAQIEAFRKGVVPRTLAEKQRSGSRSLRVWSSACSTGEEPYTLAMILAEAGLQQSGWNIEVLGSDLSDPALRTAEAGVYDGYSLRNTPETYLRRYFTGANKAFSVNKRVRDMVRYRRINLVDSQETGTVAGMDVIFCRNVLIYFNDASKRKAVSHLYDSIAKGGYLFVGFSESLHNVTRLFRPVSIENTLVYQKV